MVLFLFYSLERYLSLFLSGTDCTVKELQQDSIYPYWTPNEDEIM